MYNSHRDPIYSLALNILDGCWQIQHLYRQKAKIGQDITPDNAQDMFRCTYQLASQMHKEAISGFYYELAPALYLSGEQESDSPIEREATRYFDPVRRLSLLPQFAVKRITAGQWRLPFNKAYIQSLRARVYQEQNPYMCPLSYVPIDQIWLSYPDDDHTIDVFSILHESLYEILADAVEGQPLFQFPNRLASPERWLKQHFMDQQYEVPAVLYLLNFFPYRCSKLVTSRPTINVRYILDALGANKPTGDSLEAMQYIFLPLLKYGSASVRMWIDKLKQQVLK